MKRTTSFFVLFLLLLGAAAALPLRAANDCVGDFMQAVRVRALPGEDGIAVDVLGRSTQPVRGYSLAMGHDASLLELVAIELGPLFAGAELVSRTITNEATEETDPYGALFVVNDFQQPLDQQPVDIACDTVLTTFVYDVVSDASPGPTPLRLEHRAFGARRVSVIFVDPQNREILPELAAGEVMICGRGEPGSIAPASGGTAGGTEVIIAGEGFGEDSTVFFGARKATVLEVRGTTRLVVLTPPADAEGSVTISVESEGGGCFEVPDGFEYRDTFVRGECNGDGDLDISDALFALFYLFLDGPVPPCLDACDASDDGRVGLTDAIDILDYAFLSGAPPPAPFPFEGTDPTDDSLDCRAGESP